jgi:hypothetical protein
VSRYGDSLAVERAEMLRMIEHLEAVVTRLQDVDAGVSKECAQDLKELRNRILKTRSPTKWQLDLDFAAGVLVKIAAAVVKAWLNL